jgi:hypothetical protein
MDFGWVLGEIHTHELYYEYVYFAQPRIDDAALFVTICIYMPCVILAVLLTLAVQSTNCQHVGL